MASWAYKLAVESPYVTADVVELPEFNELKDKYAVALVPKVVINESVPYEGPWVAQSFLQAIVAQWSGDKAEESEE